VAVLRERVKVERRASDGRLVNLEIARVNDYAEGRADRQGDTVQRVADNLGITPTVIRRWNRLKGDSLASRRVLYVHLPVSPAAAAATRDTASKAKRSSHLAPASASISKSTTPKPATARHHTVRRGETLYSIANTYGTSVTALKRTNENVATLRPGMVLVIPSRQ